MTKCPLWGGQIYDITHAEDVVRETQKVPTLNARMGTGGNQVPILMGNIPEEVTSFDLLQITNKQHCEKPKIGGNCHTLCGGNANSVGLVIRESASSNGIIAYDIKKTVKVRKHDVDTDAVKTLLRDALNQSGLSKKSIAEQLGVPQTQVDHYFRQDKFFSLPDADVWIPLKKLLRITTDEFDAQIMEFDEIECNFDTANRIFDAKGIAPTITSVNADRMVLQSESMPTTGGHSELKAYAIGNGQVHQLYLQDKCGALNCMVDPMKVMQEVDENV